MAPKNKNSKNEPKVVIAKDLAGLATLLPETHFSKFHLSEEQLAQALEDAIEVAPAHVKAAHLREKAKELIQKQKDLLEQPGMVDVKELNQALKAKQREIELLREEARKEVAGMPRFIAAYQKATEGERKAGAEEAVRQNEAQFFAKQLQELDDIRGYLGMIDPEKKEVMKQVSNLGIDIGRLFHDADALAPRVIKAEAQPAAVAH